MIFLLFFIVLTILAIQDWRKLSVPLPLVGLAWALTIVDGLLWEDWSMLGRLAGYTMIPVGGIVIGRWRKDMRQWIGSGDLWVLPPVLAFFGTVSLISVFLILSGIFGLVLHKFYPLWNKKAPAGVFPLIPAFWLALLLTMVFSIVSLEFYTS